MFNERNEAKKEQEHQRVAKKNFDTELRHEKNIERLNEENEKIEKENEEKAFHKYVTFVIINFIMYI